MSLWKVSVPYAGIRTYRDVEADSEDEAIQVMQEHDLIEDEDEGSDPGAPCWAEPERTTEPERLEGLPNV